MFHSSPARWLALFPAVAAMAAVAQPAPPPVLTYRSALEGYRPFTDEKAIPWKEANETFYRRGGWQAYAKEASGAGTSEAASPKPATHPAGHSMPMPARKEQP